MLGIIHRAVIGKSPEQVRKHFILAASSVHPNGRNALRRHNRQLQSYRLGQFLETTAHSILGLVDVYNLLPQQLVNHECFRTFQRELQDMLKWGVKNGMTNWECMFLPRHVLHWHPLRQFITDDASTESVQNLPTALPAANGNTACVASWSRFGQNDPAA